MTDHSRITVEYSAFYDLMTSNSNTYNNTIIPLSFIFEIMMSTLLGTYN